VMHYINLVNPAFRPKRELLTTASLAATLCAISLVLVAGHYFAKGRADRVQGPLAVMHAQLSADQERLAVAGRAVAAATLNPKLLAEIASTRETLRVLDASMAEVASGALGDTAGFSEQFRAFARQSADGLWITGFTLSGAGKDIILNGRALSAEAVPAYIRRLNDEPAFRGKSFDVLKIAEGKPDEAAKSPPPKPPMAPQRAPASATPYVEFQLVSSAEIAAKPGAGAGSNDLATMQKSEEGKR
jgi:Fimbrial assembly protein (PilN)